MNRAFSTLFFVSLFAVPALAEDLARYALEKTESGYVRLDRQTGEMSVCAETGGQLVCRPAAEETSNAALAKRLEALEQKVAALEDGSAKPLNALPDDEEFDRTMSMMERFFRRFMGVVKEFEGEDSLPQKT